jgi:type I restriction enzyme S subunit
MKLATGWTEAAVGELTSKVGSGATPRGGNRAYKPTGTPLIRSMNVHFSGLTEKGLVFLDDEQARQLAGVTVRSHDVLLNITGASIGRVTFAPERMNGARVNQHVAIIRLRDGIEPRFVAAYLASPEAQRHILEENYGVTRQALTKSMIEEMRLPVPPLPEKRRIVAKIDDLSGKSKRARDQLDHLPRLVEKYKQAILAAVYADAQRRSDQAITLGSIAIEVRNGLSKRAVYGFSQAEVRLVADQTSNAGASTIKLDQQSIETAEQIEQAAAKSSLNIIT